MNDNRRTPAEHREAVAAHAAERNTTREPRNRNREWPTLGRLRRADAWPKIQALERFARDEGIEIGGGFHAANDNSPVDETGRTAISRVDGRMDEEMPDGDAIMAAWIADEKDRKEGRPEMATRIRFGAYGKITAIKVRGRYRRLTETFSEPRGPAEDKAKATIGAGYAMPDELPDADDEAARRIDHAAMKRRLGAEVCRVLELALGTATSEKIGEELGLSAKTAERKGVAIVDACIGKLMAEYARRDAADMAA